MGGYKCHGHAVHCVFLAPVRTRRLCGYPCEHGNATRTKEAARTETEQWGQGGAGFMKCYTASMRPFKKLVVGTGARLTLWCCGPHLLHGLRGGVEEGEEPRVQRMIHSTQVVEASRQRSQRGRVTNSVLSCTCWQQRMEGLALPLQWGNTRFSSC